MSYDVNLVRRIMANADKHYRRETKAYYRELMAKRDEWAKTWFVPSKRNRKKRYKPVQLSLLPFD